MRILITILMLAAAAPVCAETAATYSFDPTVRAVTLDKSGNQGLVREYDGKQYDGVEADLKFETVANDGYLNMGVNALNSGNEDGYFDVNLGDYLAVRGKFNILTHRQTYLRTFIAGDGQTWYKDTNYSTIHSSMTGTGMVDTTEGPSSYKRVESQLNATLSIPDSGVKLTPAFWQENEFGTTMARHSSKNVYQDVNRQTKDLSMGLNSGIGDGAFAVGYTQRTFKDSAYYAVDTSSYIPQNLYAIAGPTHKMDLYEAVMRGNMGSMPVTGALSARSRTSETNGYKTNAYSATLGTSYKLNKKTTFVAKLYGRTEGVVENTEYISNYQGRTTSNGWPFTYIPYEDTGAQIDHYNLAGELRGNYKYSEKLAFNAKYKYENNYRRHADPAGTYSTTAIQDTKNTLTAAVDANLPLDADLGLSYTKMMANRAVFESGATDQDAGGASLTMPLPSNLLFTASADYLAEKNKKSTITDSSLHQNTYNGGLEWTGSSRFSTGVDYAYEQASYHSNGYFDLSGPAAGYTAVDQPGMLYRYENNVFGYHANLKLSKAFSLDGRGSYTMSRGSIPVYMLLGHAVANDLTTITNIGLSDVRIGSGGVTLKYTCPKTGNIASLGFRRDQWVDKYTSGNSGWANVVNLTASAKF